MDAHLTRLIMMYLCFLCGIQMVFFLTTYWRKVIPLRRFAESDPDPRTQLLAPPVWWTFAYHSIVCCIVWALGAASLIRLNTSVPVTPVMYVLIFLIVALTVVMTAFLHYYITRLEKYLRHRNGESPTDVTSK